MRSLGSRLGSLIKLIFILIILTVIAVAFMPLNLYYDHVESYLKPVKLSGIGGSAIKGNAESLQYMSMSMGQAEWLLYPKSLTSLGGTVKVAKENYDLTFELQRITQEDVIVDQLQGYIDWNLIKPYLQMRYGKINGYAQFNLHSILYNKNNGIERLNGEITLKDLKLLQPVNKDMGEVSLTFETKSKGVIIGQFTSQSNMLQVSGSLVFQPHRWQLNLDLIPKAGHFELDAILNSIGDARRGGGRRLKLAGFY